MGSPWDVAFGRLAVQQGMVAQEAVRAVYLQLPPGRTLKDELIARRLLAPDRAQALEAMLRGAAPAPAGDDSATMKRPAPKADDSATMLRPGASSPSSRFPAARPAGATRLPDVGETIAGRYQLAGLLGKGGMGAVFKARDAQTGELFAVKVLLPGSDPGGMVLARFRREAEAVAKVDAHAGIVRVRGLGEHQGLPYVVMDLVVGDDLHKIVKNTGPLELARALRYTEAVARAVQHCHDKGVLHRDLKPANVLLRAADDAPLVMDFGLALDTSADRLTKTGEVMGTPAYMSPEQADGNKAETDARTDIYALGAILYALVAGNAPFVGEPIQILAQVFRDLPSPIAATRTDVPTDLDVIVRKAMAKDKNLRYATARDLADDVGRLARGEPITARPPTAREELEWRARRGDIPARLRLHKRWAIAALALLLLILVALEVKTRILDAQFASILAEVPTALREDGPLEVGVVTSAVVARLMGHAPPADGVDARLYALAELGERPLAGFEREANVLGADRATQRAVRVLARRLALTNGRVHAAPLDADATPEDRLMRALALLRWGQPTGPEEAIVAHGADVEEARALLASAATDATTVGAAANSVLTSLAAVDEAVRARLTMDGRDLVNSVKAALADPRTKLNDPYARADLPIKPTALQAYGHLELVRGRPATIPGVIAAITTLVDADDPRAWRRDRRKYEVIATAVRVCLGPVAVQPSAHRDPVLAEKMEALLSKIGGRVFQQTAEVSCMREFAQLVNLAGPFVGRTNGADLRRLTVDAVFLSISSSFEKNERPDLATIMLLPSLHRLPTARVGFERYFKAAVEEREIDDYVAKHKSGDGYLVWAQLLCSIREYDDREDVELMTTIREKFAAALGEHLDAATRTRLALGPPAELLVPLTPFFVPQALARVAVFTVRIERKSGTMRRPVLEAALELLTRLRLTPGDDAVKQQKLAHEEADALMELLFLGNVDAAWRKALETRLEGALAAEVEQGWLIARGVATGERREGYEEGSAGAADVRQDEDHLKNLLQDPIRDLAAVFESSGRMAAALDLVTRSIERYRALGSLPFPYVLLRTQTRLRLKTNDLEGAAAVAREVIEEARARPGADPESRKEPSEMRSDARAVLARVLLRQGDAAGARAALEAALRDGDPCKNGQWDALREELAGR